MTPEKKEEMMSQYADLKRTIESEHFDTVLAAGDKEGYERGLAEGKASVVQPVEGGQYDQAAMDQYAAQKVEEFKASLPADTTPFSQADLDALQAKVDAANEHAAKFQANDEDQEKALARFEAVFSEIGTILKNAKGQGDNGTRPEDANAPLEQKPGEQVSSEDNMPY